MEKDWGTMHYDEILKDEPKDLEFELVLNKFMEDMSNYAVDNGLSEHFYGADPTNISSYLSICLRIYKKKVAQQVTDTILGNPMPEGGW